MLFFSNVLVCAICEKRIIINPYFKKKNLACSSTTSRNLGREPFTGVGIKREIIKIHVK
jgi:hypothetical protein